MHAASSRLTAAAFGAALLLASGSANALCLTGEEIYPDQLSQKTPDHCAVCAVPPGTGMMAPEGRPAATLRMLPQVLRPAAPGATSTAGLAPCPPAPAEEPTG